MVQEIMVPSQFESYQRLKKWYLMPASLLKSMHYKVWIKGKVSIQWKKWRPPRYLGIVTIEKGAFKSSPTHLTYIEDEQSLKRI